MKTPSQVRERIWAEIVRAGGPDDVLGKTVRVRDDGTVKAVCSLNMLEKFKYGLSALGPKTVAELRVVLPEVAPEDWLAAMGATPSDELEGAA